MKNRLEHLVTITLTTSQYDTSEKRIFDLFMEIEDILTEVLSGQQLGYVDGHEFCETPDKETLTYFLYGPNAEKIVTAITPLVLSFPKSTKPQINISSE